MIYDDKFKNKNAIRTKCLWIVILSMVLALLLFVVFIAVNSGGSPGNSYASGPTPLVITGREVTPTPTNEPQMPEETPTPVPTETPEPETTDIPEITPKTTEVPENTVTIPEHVYSPWTEDKDESGDITEKSPFIPIAELFPNLSTYFKKGDFIELNLLLQNPELPYGCESVALTMILNYYGFNLPKTYIADNYLIYGDNFVTSYEGNPYGDSGGAIYAPGLASTANDFLTSKGSTLKAYDVIGGEFFELITKYIYHDIPVVIFTTRGYVDVEMRDVTREYDGKTWQAAKYRHCVVMAGYDDSDDSVLIYDPLEGIIKINREIVENIYNNYYKMAVVVK